MGMWMLGCSINKQTTEKGAYQVVSSHCLMASTQSDIEGRNLFSSQHRRMSDFTSTLYP